MSKVYFLLAPSLALVKIGVTTNVKARMTSFGDLIPVDLVLVGTVRGDRDTEKAYHARFRHSHERGEWFRVTPDLQAVLDEVAGTPDVPDKTVTAKVAGEMRTLTPEEFFAWGAQVLGPHWLNGPALGFTGPQVKAWVADAAKGVCSIPPRAVLQLADAERYQFSRYTNAREKFSLGRSPTVTR